MDDDVKLSPSREFCLRAVANGARTNQQVSLEAAHEGMNRRRSRLEWADQSMRWLRHNGLIARDKRLGRRWSHKITEKGMDALARIEAMRSG